MGAFEFAASSPWIAFFIVAVVSQAFVICVGRILRHMNIRKNGWPPEHLDADGDFLKTEKE